jgi:hypothetical protein
LSQKNHKISISFKKKVNDWVTEQQVSSYKKIQARAHRHTHTCIR